MEDCLLGSAVNRDILERILGWMKQYRITAYRENTGEGLVRHVLIRSGFATGEIMVCLVVNGTKLPREKELVQSLRTSPA